MTVELKRKKIFIYAINIQPGINANENTEEYATCRKTGEYASVSV